MPRQRSEYAATHEALARIEPRLSRAVLKATEKLRDGISINALAMALAAKDVKAALALLGSVEDALAPTQGIVTDAFARGGRIGAAQVNKLEEA